jgi:dipeptidyl aminopeptidase/acylaminoacyl peptidase
MKKKFARSFVFMAPWMLFIACAKGYSAGSDEESVNAVAASQATELAEQVARMGAIGFSYGGVFSPNADRVAFISNASGVPNVWIADAKSGNLQRLTDSEHQVGPVRWSPVNDTLAVEIAPGGGLNSQIYLMSATGGEMQMITTGGKANNWLTRWSEDGRYLNFSSSTHSENGMDCWLHDTQSGKSRLIVKNNGIGACVLSPNNKSALVWRMVSRGDTNLYLVDIETGEESILTPHEGVALSEGPVFLDDETIVFATNVERDLMALARVKISDGVGAPLEILYERDDAEVSGIGRLANGRLLIVWNAAGLSELTIFDSASGKMVRGPDLPAELTGDPEVSSDGTQALLTVSGSASPSDVWHLDIQSEEFSKISQTPHEGVDLASLVKPTLKTYTAHDGLELTGWLYLPPGHKRAGPMVLSFHGGPEAQERPRFRATYQALLSRGIAVFAPNVRGSSGFGKAFMNLDNGELRFDSVRDIRSTTDFVSKAGFADPDRIGIMGGSYGGYMVMAAITEYPRMFAAAANLYGIVNFETFFAHTEPWMAAISTVEYGDPATETDMLKRLSPIHRIDRIVTPTIVLHGANDTNVPVVEAEQVVHNLEARKVPVKYVLFKDEGHGWSKVANRVNSDVEIVTWFAEYL